MLPEQCSRNKKSGKLSCCAHGGSWFKNCGDDGDQTFDHTWSEGIRACAGFAGPLVVDAALKAYTKGVMDSPVNITKRRYTTEKQNQMNMHSAQSMTDVSCTKSTACDALVKVIAFMDVLLVIARHNSCVLFRFPSVITLVVVTHITI